MKWNPFKPNNNDSHIAEQIKAAANIEMDGASRERMRAHLSEYAQFQPIRARSSLHAQPHNRFAQFVVFFSTHVQSVSVVAALLIVIVSGGATVAAAEMALPGDILYPIKVHVTEEVQASLAISPKAKAAWAMDRAERRLEEAATLALAGKLNDVTRAQIDSNLDEHVQSAKENRKTLEKENSLSAAEEVWTNIGAVALARKNILGESDAKHTAEVAVRADVARPANGGASNTISTSTRASKDESQVERKIVRDESDTIAKARRTAAKVRIEAIKKFLSLDRNHLGADVSARVQAQLQTAADTLSTGDADAARGNTEEASSNFDSALQAATDIQTLISVSNGSSTNSNGQDSQDKNGDGQKRGESGIIETHGISL